MIRRTIAMAALAVCASLAASPADERKPQDLKDATRETATVVRLSQGEQQALTTKGNIRLVRVEDFDGKLLTVKAYTPVKVILSAQAKGCSRLKLTDETGQTEHLLVIIE